MSTPVRNYFTTGASTFDIVLPVSWEYGRPIPITQQSPQAYMEVLAKIPKEHRSFEVFRWEMWRFAQESFIREASTVTDEATGMRYLDQHKFRENKVRFLLLETTLGDSDGALVALQRAPVDGRMQLTQKEAERILMVDSNLMFTALTLADTVLNGQVAASLLYTLEEFKQLQSGSLPPRYTEKPKATETSPKA